MTDCNGRKEPIGSGESLLHASLLLVALALASACAIAQPKPVSTSAGVATYQGADRQQRLIEGAKKEGELLIYSSMPAASMAAVTAAFEKKYGIKAKVWRSGSENVLQRTVAEAKAGRFDADIIETNGPEMEVLHREKLLQEVKSPYLSELIAEAILPHREWVSNRSSIFVAAYNTNLIKKEDLPRTYQDLLHPKWKGKLGIEKEDFDWFSGVIADLGEDAGLKLFRDIVAINGLSVRKGHSLLAGLVASGEVPLALTVYNFNVEQLKNKGAPIDWFVIGTHAIGRPNGVGVALRAPHPNAAVLFFDFCLTEAQEILLKLDFSPTSKKLKTPLTGIPLRFIDVKTFVDEHAKWARLYEDTITKPR